MIEVLGAEGEPAEPDAPLPAELPVLPLRDSVTFPDTLTPLAVGQDRSVRLVNDVLVGNRMLVMLASKEPEVDAPDPEQLYDVGVAGTVARMLKVPDGSLRILVQGGQRVKVEEWVGTDPYLTARVSELPDVVEEGPELTALMRNVQETFSQIIEEVPYLPEELQMAVVNLEDPSALSHLIAGALRIGSEERQALLEEVDVGRRLRRLSEILARELDIVAIGSKIQSQVNAEMEKGQREWVLRQQMKAIQEELGEQDPAEAEVDELRSHAAASSTCPSRCARRSTASSAGSRSSRRRRPSTASSAPTWSGWPRCRGARAPRTTSTSRTRARCSTRTTTTSTRSRTASSSSSPSASSSRTRAARSCASPARPASARPRSASRSPARWGASSSASASAACATSPRSAATAAPTSARCPGTIIRALRDAESNNPVFMIDEIDKLGADYRGDPASAMLEVLDPEQNATFRDHYLDVPFDLSRVMFICTANDMDRVPGPLRDRMEVISLAGYTEEEKLQIAKRYLVPRQIERNGLKKSQIGFSDAGLREIVTAYTREAGVRSLEREIGSVCRKVAVEVAEGRLERKLSVTAPRVRELLGRPRFKPDVRRRTAEPGVATGLAWTPVGGDVLFVEASAMPGKGNLTITGQLGDVMQESAQAALSYVRGARRPAGRTGSPRTTCTSTSPRGRSRRTARARASRWPPR